MPLENMLKRQISYRRLYLYAPRKGLVAMKKLVLVFVLVMVFLVSGCGNSGNLTEGLNTASNTFNYILTQEAGEYRLHHIRRWKDSESDALGVNTLCCDNQFWTSYNSAILYTDMPAYLPDTVIICGK